MGHIARNCPHAKDQVNKGNNKRYHAHPIEYDAHVQNKEREYCSSEE